MKILLLSIHPLIDNRINKHIGTLLKNGYCIEYINVSEDNISNLGLERKIKLENINKNFDLHKPFSIMKIYKDIKKYIKNSDAKIVHIHDIFLLPLVPYIRRSGKKVVFDKHESFEKINAVSAKVITFYERIIAKKIDGIVYTADQQLNFIKKNKYKRYIQVPNYQEISKYSSIKISKKNKENFTVVYIGSLSTKDRDILLLLNVFENLIYKNKSINCILGGKIFHDEVKSKVIDLSNKYKENFKYLGVIPYDEVVKINKKADIGLLFFKDDPNTYNSSSNKLYEYLLSGTIFIGVGKFILGDEIKESNAGNIFDFDTREEKISEYILNIIRNENKLNEMKKNAYNLGVNYTWESIEKRYINLYEEILNEGECL
ncbi:glycosyltransferase [Clostridium perfringens]|uniref:glycosyltransferase n=1 Tax=Clostridium perfringens TaxID=1502 RepID=UPI002AC3A639|nr:glycosyltransferase [Clostridium perfringens]MDK0841041.1 glycosyltransferase [Clostridium perfringens]MDZ4937185.1 glycosyltransferase [Clostridium perfringens]